MANAPKRAVTIQDVALAAQVSTKTVSRVINNEAGVNAETRAKVAQIVKELDYRPNLNAQSLAGDRSFLIGLFIENPGSYVTDFQTGVIQRCREAWRALAQILRGMSLHRRHPPQISPKTRRKFSSSRSQPARASRRWIASSSRAA